MMLSEHEMHALIVGGASADMQTRAAIELAGLRAVYSALRGKHEEHGELRAVARRLLLASNAGREAIQRVMDLIRPGCELSVEEVECVCDAWLGESAIFQERREAANALAVALGMEP